VVRLTGFTSVPGTEDFLLGVANLRGEIVPVFDLMLFFGFASQGLLDRSRVIVVGAEDIEFGIIADSVEAVTHVPLDALVGDAAFEGKRGDECVRGVTRDAMIVLDGAALLKDRRLFIGGAPDASAEASK
jgi:purine-binding chemotaxis protein CheW